MEICEYTNCTGCEACANICGIKAVSMCPDEKGFLRPIIDEEKCVNCGKCRAVCPQNNQMPQKNSTSVRAAVSLDEEIREESSSGGVFSVLAEWVLRQRGIVIGAAYDDGMVVRHTVVQSMAELPRLRGSKYVQSAIGDIYQQVKKYLEQGRKVLFSGTPCQIAGLKSFLQKEEPDLLTIDILCHGTPSPVVFQKYVHEIETSYGSKLCNIRFRSKATGWKNYCTELVFVDERRVCLGQDLFMDGFLQNLYLRESCYECRYATAVRVGDITLGDFWGYRSVYPQYLLDDDRGISLVMINTEKGKHAINSVKKKLQMVERDLSDAKQGNKVLESSFSKPETSDAFWAAFVDCSWKELSQEFFPENPARSKLQISGYNYSMPYKLRNKIHVVRCWLTGIWRRIRRAIR